MLDNLRNWGRAMKEYRFPLSHLDTITIGLKDSCGDFPRPDWGPNIGPFPIKD